MNRTAVYGLKSETTAGLDYSVADAMADYLEWFRAHRKSYSRTKQQINAHILPKLGRKRLADLTKGEVKAWHTSLVSAPVRRRGCHQSVDIEDAKTRRKRQSTANRVLTILKAALEHALDNDRVSSDDAWHNVKPFRNVDKPSRRFLSESECKRLEVVPEI